MDVLVAEARKHDEKIPLAELEKQLKKEGKLWRYTLSISKIAGKELKKLPAKEVKKIFPKIKSLSINPRPEGCKKLKGESESLWRIRVGDYRIIYTIWWFNRNRWHTKNSPSKGHLSVKSFHQSLLLPLHYTKDQFIFATHNLKLC